MALTTKAKIGDVIRIDKDTKAEYGHNVTFTHGDYVVENTAMTGGGTGHGPHDVYPDGWHVVARKLHKDGTYNPKGKTIRFFQSGCFTGMIPRIEVVRKMTRYFS